MLAVLRGGMPSMVRARNTGLKLENGTRTVCQPAGAGSRADAGVCFGRTVALDALHRWYHTAPKAPLLDSGRPGSALCIPGCVSNDAVYPTVSCRRDSSGGAGQQAGVTAGQHNRAGVSCTGLPHQGTPVCSTNKCGSTTTMQSPGWNPNIKTCLCHGFRFLSYT